MAHSALCLYIETGHILPLVAHSAHLYLYEGQETESLGLHTGKGVISEYNTMFIRASWHGAGTVQHGTQKLLCERVPCYAEPYCGGSEETTMTHSTVSKHPCDEIELCLEPIYYRFLVRAARNLCYTKWTRRMIVTLEQPACGHDLTCKGQRQIRITCFSYFSSKGTVVAFWILLSTFYLFTVSH